MALQREEAEPEAQQLRDLYAACDPTGWDACRLRGERFGWAPIVRESVEWSDFQQWKWTGWNRWLHRYSSGPVGRGSRGQQRFARGSRGTRNYPILKTSIGQRLVQSACDLARMSWRQTEVWMMTEAGQMSQRQITAALEISQPMVNKHLGKARSRLATEWQAPRGVITPSLRVREQCGCAWKYRGFECRGSCQQKQISS